VDVGKKYAITFVLGLVFGLIVLMPMVLIAIWQLTPMPSGTVPTTSGFSKIKPQIAGTSMTYDGNFTGVFTNGAGTTINISEGGFLIRSLDGVWCSGKSEQTILRSGDNFIIRATGCQSGQRGEFYYVSVSIPYSVSVGGLSSYRTEDGAIRGLYE
jgi:hypothetical protein